MRSGEHLVPLVVMVALAVVASCKERDEVPPELKMMKALRNMEYRSEFASGGKAKVVEGVYTEPAAPGSSSQVTVQVTSWLGVEDLNDDDEVDGVAVLATNAGGSGTFYELAAVVGGKAGPTHVASAPLGDRVEIEALRVSKGWVTVDLLEHGADEPMSSASLPVKRTYRLVEGNLVLAE